MPDYKSMYYALAARVADAIELLTSAQLDGEESAMRGDAPALRMDTAPADRQE